MTRIRLIMLSLLAVFAISAVSSASASAATECEVVGAPLEQGGDVALCKGSPYVEVGSPTEHAPVPFTSTKTASTTSKLEVEGGPKIVCTAATNTGEFDISNGNIKDSGNVEVSDVYITFTGCKVTNTKESEEKCTVKSPGRTNGTIVVSGGTTGRIPPESSPDDGLDAVFPNASESNPVPIVFAPSEGEVFVTIEIGNVGEKTCPFTKGSFHVTGKQKGTTGTSTKDACEARKVHTLTFLPSGSELKFGTSNAKFELTEDVELTSKEVWGLCPS